jgi:hypothetical protein
MTTEQMDDKDAQRAGYADAADQRAAQRAAFTPVSANTKAEEPIEDRLRRAWLNGFREGFERGSYIQRFDA